MEREERRKRVSGRRRGGERKRGGERGGQRVREGERGRQVRHCAAYHTGRNSVSVCLYIDVYM
jgi:hypothetical protein